MIGIGVGRQGGEEMEWLKNIGAAIDYIEENLDKELSYETAAGIACCSPHYFQRIFSYIFGISLAEYVRRRKMTQAAFELQRTDSKVMDIALKYGYSSPTSFNRAFQSVHGVTPASAKSKGCSLSAYPPMSFSVKVTGGSSIPYHIEEKESLRMVGIKMPLVEDMEENMHKIPLFWKQAFHRNQIAELESLCNGRPCGILGVSVYGSAENFYYYIGAASDAPVPEGMSEYRIPEATRVVFENNGSLKEDVQGIFRRFMTEFLPFSGYDYAGLPDIEVYPFSADKLMRGHSEVWIAIKKAKENE